MCKQDLTLPGRKRYWGKTHPILLYKRKIEQIFNKMGFSLEAGAEIEADYHAYEALNFSPHHSVRSTNETLHINESLSLRSHLTPLLIRIMQKKKPPLRIIVSGKVFCKKNSDPRNALMLFQVGGLVVDHSITFSHLKGILGILLKYLFNERIKIRFRPGFFPITEPSVEADISCTNCEGKEKKCWKCKGTGWIKILEAGMVSHQVLKNVNINPEKYSGFVFNMEIDRVARIFAPMSDQGSFYNNNIKYNRQFF